MLPLPGPAFLQSSTDTGLSSLRQKMAPRFTLALLCLVSVVSAVPAPQPLITPPPSLAARDARALAERDIFDAATSYVGGLISSLGSSVSGYVASGVPQFFQDLPTGTAVESSLGISDDDLAASPTQVLNVP